MQPVTVRFDYDELEAIDEEVEDKGFNSRSQYIRWIVRNRDGIDSNTQAVLDEHDERLAELESAVFDG